MRIQARCLDARLARWVTFAYFIGLLVGLLNMLIAGLSALSLALALACLFPAAGLHRRLIRQYRTDPAIETVEILDGMLRRRGPEVRWSVPLSELTVLDSVPDLSVQARGHVYFLPPLRVSLSLLTALLLLERARAQAGRERVTTPAPPKALRRLRKV